MQNILAQGKSKDHFNRLHLQEHVNKFENVTSKNKKTACMFLFQRIFMALSMKYNVPQISAEALRDGTYLGGSIFDDFLA